MIARVARSLAAKQLVLLLVASALPVLAAALAVFIGASRILEGEAHRLLDARADEIAAKIDNFHRTYALVGFRLAQFPRLVERAAERDPEIDTVLGYYASSDLHFRSVAVTDGRGVVTCSSDRRQIGLELGHYGWFAQAQSGRSVISDVFLGDGDLEATALIAYATPVVAADRSVVGVTVLLVRAGALWDEVRAGNGQAGAGSFSVLYDGHGIRIGHSFNDPEVFRPAGPLPQEVIEAAVAERRFGDRTRELLERPSPMPAELAAARADHVPTGAVRGHSPANDQVNVGVARRMKAVRWTLFVMVPEDSMFAPARALVSTTVMISLAVVAGGLVVGVLLSRRFLRPVRSLAAAARRVEQGDLTTRVEVESVDELGELARAFNAMTEAVKAGHEQLEGRVRERTIDLERANDELLAQKQELLAQREELRAQQSELESKQVELERASQMKSQFMANMSHELRTPLNSIIGFSELLLDEQGLSDRQTRHLGDVLSSGRHLLELINDILDLSKIEAGHVSMERVPVEAETAISDAVAVISAAARKKQVEVRKVCRATRAANADPGRLRQVLLNLLSNAVKFSAQGTVVEVGAEDRGSMVRFWVKDQGPGIPDSLRPRLFEPFVQGESPLVKKHQGTGLGLAISRKLVRQHGGELDLDRDGGPGATFAFTLPSVERSQRPRNTPSIEPHPAPRILVIEDAVPAGESLRAKLEQSGFRPTVVAADQDVIEVCRALRPNAIVLDPSLATADGPRILDTLKRSEVTRDIPLVVSSAPGAASFVPKPLERERLLTELERLTAGRPRPPKILAIDDDPRVGKLLRSLVEPAGYRLVSELDPREGLALAERDAPDLLIVDLLMPEMSGFDVIDALAASPATRRIPVVVLTAADISDADRTRLRSRARAIAQKGDLTRDDLLAVVRRVLGGVVPSVDAPSGARVLVADDHDLNRELARSILERRGHEVLLAEDGAAAVAIARRDRPSLILMDLSMPVQDGFAAARELKSDPALAGIPIVALTAMAMRGDEEKAYAAGFDGYLTKPIDREALEATVQRFLARSG